MLIVKETSPGQFKEILFGSSFTGSGGALHGWQCIELWSDAQLAQVGVYKVDPAALPSDPEVIVNGYHFERILEVIITGMMPDVLDDNYKVATNEDWLREYQLKINNVVVPIELDWKLYMQMQSKAGSLVLTASTANQRLVVTDRAAGKFALQVKLADAAQIEPGDYDYDIVLVAGDGIYRLARGTIAVDKGITLVPGQEKWSHFPLILRP